MEVNIETRIPTLFWYSLAYAIFVISTGVVYMEFHSTNTSLEAFGVKLDLQRALAREHNMITAVESNSQTNPSIKQRLDSWKNEHIQQYDEYVLPKAPPQQSIK